MTKGISPSAKSVETAKDMVIRMFEDCMALKVTKVTNVTRVTKGHLIFFLIDSINLISR
jgi:hypothetical protein